MHFTCMQNGKTLLCHFSASWHDIAVRVYSSMSVHMQHAVCRLDLCSWYSLCVMSCLRIYTALNYMESIPCLTLERVIWVISDIEKSICHVHTIKYFSFLSQIHLQNLTPGEAKFLLKIFENSVLSKNITPSYNFWHNFKLHTMHFTLWGTVTNTNYFHSQIWI